MLYYRYSGSTLIGFNYQNNDYTYIKNLHNDITGIMDSNFNIIVNYTYDSWGKITSMTDEQGIDISTNINHIGYINPFRYRGYYYDSETELYYLNSRYYSPEMGRYLNAGVYISTGQGLLGNNMYVYCNNNPINNADPNGNWFSKIIATIALTIAKVIVKAVAKVVITVASNIFLGVTGSDTGRDTFNKAMWHSDGFLPYSTETSLAKKIQDSEQLKTEVDICFEKANGRNFDQCHTQNLNFTSDDLLYSVGKANAYISAWKNIGGNWTVTVNVYDTYNFDATRLQNGWSFSNAANDLGYYMEQFGLLTPYDWNITFRYDY